MNRTLAKQQLLEERMLDLSVEVISLCKELPNTDESKVLKVQLIKSATSIGANYTEANNASSKMDFRNKIFIAKKEASETRYWLKLLVKLYPQISIKNTLDETTELIFILQKIVTTMKNAK